MTVTDELDQRFREAAVDEGLVDVAYDTMDSPIGPLLVAATDDGLCRIGFEGHHDEDLELVAREYGARVLRLPRRTDAARRQLDEYFGGRRREFDLDVDLRAAPAFHRVVLDELARVPYGSLTTYGALAQKVGRPKAARAVGGAMHSNRIPIVLPCHRVVGSNGSLTGYAGGLHVKRTLLEHEGALTLELR
jgi:methylated-DNA-[protein]-cysteine S-methyltransferase